jgi:hypothetical protein
VFLCVALAVLELTL